MAITHPTAVRDTVCNTVVALLDAGGAGTIELQISLGGVAAAIVDLQATAFGASASGIATANTPMEEASAPGNVSPVSHFQAKSGAGTVIFQGEVATSGSDINLSSLTIGNGDTVQLSSLTYEAMP